MIVSIVDVNLLLSAEQGSLYVRFPDKIFIDSEEQN